MIKITDLSKSYNHEIILKKISLTVDQGEIFGIIGQSGAGKSTLLRCINGLEKIDSGSLLVDGVELNNIREKDLRNLRKNIGIIFQDFALLNQKSVKENIALPLRCWKYDTDYINKKVDDLLDIVGLSHKSDSMPGELSGGQKQRVAIARSLTLNPSLLLCDEATSALDPKSTKNILRLISDINNNLNITVVIVTHEMNVIKEICDRVSVIDEGSIKAIGGVEDVLLAQSDAYDNLIGYERIKVPKGQLIVKIFIKSVDYNRSIIWELIKKANIKPTILTSDLQQYSKKGFGYITIAIPEQDLDKTISYCNLSDIHYKVLKGAE